ncbi:DUF4350 domain-containing protein [Mobiluncus curtisii]|uniref:DUF4350 domain-containing protein n=2 Tax=Mobiluncus curtisii TaxID=2051 RepID=D6ZJ33_MOBCV|nr:DUF4350 domain-containing protein [Mobiluncus curtisii]ADI66732.1 hypothetical protein HMPREF0573_10413 [Mobiluncus curtisii ATCC 43063]EFL93224.1 hypothetical protein HMPREF0574_1825 [Mobiluncus curtisii subsp. curtisii ATCC 35241]NMW45104.1 hypothetical protein [Mobiluncus curtisii]NMW88285.1 hypothetical protein [Mobiluncus curtisii]QQT13769.1 hypothetical protein I6I84_02900 [Mobiluncus curtisii]
MSSATPPTATPRISEAIFRSRWVIGGLILLAVFSFLSAVLRAPTDDVDLSIRNPKGSGAMALAEVLRHRGVMVKDVYSMRDLDNFTSKDTVVITNTNEIDDVALREILHTPTNLLIIGTLAQGKRFDPYVQSVPAGTPDGIEAQCDFPGAKAAQTISSTRGSLRPLRQPEAACFPVQDNAFAYVSFKRPEGFHLALLSEDSLARNDTIASAGNAALLLNLLGSSPQVGWVNGTTFQQGSDQNGKDQPLLPDFFLIALVYLFVAAFVFTLAQGRRLGRVVPEELPVVVHGAEAVYGRGHLYEKSGAVAAAAHKAREYTARRIGSALHIPTPTTPPVMVREVSRYTGIAESQIHELLYGEVPTTARGLGNLMHDLYLLTKLNPRKES